MLHQKAGRILGRVLILYALLVATHLGEFWPFSIYPMFSQAGNEWSKSLVYHQDDPLVIPDWQQQSAGEPDGEVLSLRRIGLSQNDLAGLLTRTDAWSQNRVSHVRRLLSGGLDDGTLVVYLVRGVLTGEQPHDRELQMCYTPYLYIYPDSVAINPKLEMK